MDIPVVGRENVLDYLEELLDAGSGGVVLVGKGGVGKSRLALELLKMGEARGFATARTVGTRAAATVPLGALSPLLPEVTGSAGNMLAEAVSSLGKMAAGRTLMLLVDDAHLLDEHSATLLIHLALNLPSFLVMTVRSGELLSEALVSIWKDGLVQRAEIPPLDDVAIGEMVTLLLDGRVEPALVSLIVSKAAGNPLVTRELVQAGIESGVVRLEEDCWRLNGELEVSARLIELIAARVGTLRDGERTALEIVSFGEPLPLAIAKELSHPEALAVLERRGIIITREDGRRTELWLSHPIHSEVVRASTSHVASTEHMERLSKAVEGTGMRRRGDLRRVVSLRLDSGHDVDPDLLMAAAIDTQAALDMAGTARFARGAWDRRPDFAAGLLTGTALSFLNRFEEADAMLAAAGDLASSQLEVATAAARRSFVLAHGMGLEKEALDLLGRMQEDLTDPDGTALVVAQRACLLARARANTSEIISLAVPLVSSTFLPARVVAAYAAVVAFVNRGEYTRALDLIDGSSEEHRFCWFRGLVHLPPQLLEHHRAASYTAMGEFANVQGRSSSPLDGSPIPGRRSMARLDKVVLARAAIFQGKPRDTVDILSKLPSPEDREDRQVAALLAMAAALVGEAGAAQRHMETVERATASGPRPFDALLDEAQAWTFMVSGFPEEARRVLVAAIEEAAHLEEWGMALPLVLNLARFGDPDGALYALEEFDVTVDGPVPEALFRFIRGLATRDPKVLEEVSECLEERGADLLAADAAAGAAREWSRRDQGRRAMRCRQHTFMLLRRCQGATTPMTMGLDALIPLTDRETEVASLAALGLSNRQIAERLFVSVRTIDNHLQHAYQKLGVSSRTDLASAISPGPATT